MESPRELSDALSRIGMYTRRVDFDSLVAFVAGYDLATNGAALEGFHEWLVVKKGDCDNIAWPELVLEIVIDESGLARNQLIGDSADKLITDSLMKLLNEFWQGRSSVDGMRRIYRSYETWLLNQKWYLPNSPRWIKE